MESVYYKFKLPIKTRINNTIYYLRYILYIFGFTVYISICYLDITACIYVENLSTSLEESF